MPAPDVLGSVTVIGVPATPAALRGVSTTVRVSAAAPAVFWYFTVRLAEFSTDPAGAVAAGANPLTVKAPVWLLVPALVQDADSASLSTRFVTEAVAPK